MEDIEHSKFIKIIIDNPEIFKKFLLADKALSNMIKNTK